MKRDFMLTDTLKEKTQTLHDKLEANPFMQKLLLGTFNQEDYRLLLTLFHEVHRVIESQLCAFEELQMPKRQRLASLREDLCALACDDKCIASIPQGDLEIKIDTLSGAYGALYVLEGSRMGGQFLSKMVQKALGEKTPVAYFDGLGAQTLAYVQELKAFINSQEDTIDTKACVQCAKDVFVFLDYAFETHRPAAQEG